MRTTSAVKHVVPLQVMATDSEEKSSSPVTESNQLTHGEESVNSTSV